MTSMEFIDWGDERYVRVSDLISMLIGFAPVVRDKLGADWPVTNVIAHILVEDVRDPAAVR